MKRWFDGFGVEKLTVEIKPHPQTEALLALQVPRRIVARRNTTAVDERVGLHQIISPATQLIEEAPKPARLLQRRNTTAIEKATDLTNNKVKNVDTLTLVNVNTILPPKPVSKPMQSDAVKIKTEVPRSLHLSVPLQSTSRNSIAGNSKNDTSKENSRVEKTSQNDRIHLRWNMTANDGPIDLSIKSRSNDDISPFVNVEYSVKNVLSLAKENSEAYQPLCLRKMKNYVPRTLFFSSNESNSHNQIYDKTLQNSNHFKKKTSNPNHEEIQKSKLPVPNLISMNVLREKNTAHKHHPEPPPPNFATHPLQYAAYLKNILEKK